MQTIIVRTKLSLLLAGVLCLVLAFTSGCIFSPNRDSLLAACTQAIQESAAADQQLLQALLDHNTAEKAALDAAFLEDFRKLSEKDGGKVAYQDIAAGKAIYDGRLQAILMSRDRIREFFARKERTAGAALDLIAKARDLDSIELQALNETNSIAEALRQFIESNSNPIASGKVITIGPADTKGGSP